MSKNGRLENDKKAYWKLTLIRATWLLEPPWPEQTSAERQIWGAISGPESGTNTMAKQY